MNLTKSGKYSLFFVIPALTVLVSAKQPTSSWETTILVGTMLLQGCIAVKALQSDPNSTDASKSANMNGHPTTTITTTTGS